MKTIRLLSVILVLLAGAALILQGCSGGGSDQEASRSGPPALNRALAAEPESLDPQKSRSTQAADVLRDIGEGLVTYTAAGELVPGTAASWEMSSWPRAARAPGSAKTTQPTSA